MKWWFDLYNEQYRIRQRIVDEIAEIGQQAVGQIEAVKKATSLVAYTEKRKGR